jgi:hypothetical protein
MKKNSIVQFVCFVTNLELEDFVVKWEPYAKQLVADGEIILQEGIAVKGKNKYRYVSQHTCGTADFKFIFMKGKKQENFPEHRARVVNAGGYKPVQLQCLQNEIKNDVKVMAFLSPGETDLTFYHRQNFRHLNIYAAYYESCIYSYVLEYFLQEADAEVLVEQLNTRIGIEVGVYTECPVMHS